MILIKGFGYTKSVITLGFFRKKEIKAIKLISKTQLKVNLNAKFDRKVI
jgi:hypothetical protein